MMYIEKEMEMTKRKAAVADEAVVEETLEKPVVVGEDEVQDLEEKIEISLKADPNALMLPECEIHHFEFLRTVKIMGNKSTEGTRFRRVDTFYCTGCLRYTTVAREEVEKFKPEWFMGN